MHCVVLSCRLCVTFGFLFIVLSYWSKEDFYIKDNEIIIIIKQENNEWRIVKD